MYQLVLDPKLNIVYCPFNHFRHYQHHRHHHHEIQR